MKRLLVFIMLLILMPSMFSCDNSIIIDELNIGSKAPSINKIDDSKYDEFGNYFYLYSNQATPINLTINDNKICYESFRDLRLLFMHKKNSSTENNRNSIPSINNNDIVLTTAPFNTSTTDGFLCVYAFYFNKVNKNSILKIKYNSKKTYRFAFKINEFSSFDEYYHSATREDVEQSRCYNFLKSLRIYNPSDYASIRDEIKKESSYKITTNEEHSNVTTGDFLENISLSNYYKLINTSLALPESLNLYSVYTQEKDDDMVYTKGLAVGEVLINYDKDIINENDYMRAKISSFILYVAGSTREYKPAKNKLFYGDMTYQYHLEMNSPQAEPALIIKNKNKLFSETINGIDVVFFNRASKQIYAVYEYNSNYYYCS